MEPDEQLDLVMQIVLAYLDGNEIPPAEVAPMIDGVASGIARIARLIDAAAPATAK